VALNFRLIGDRALRSTARSVRYEQSIIDPAAAEVLKRRPLSTPQRHPQQRPKIKADAGRADKVAGQDGIQVTEVSIKDIRFDKDFEQAVEQADRPAGRAEALRGRPGQARGRVQGGSGTR
jgi:regulator of protease activity HflC (stomatin/prohibitin superfamily)